jgi:membrane protein DedA with SNARE-associated domain
MLLDAHDKPPVMILVAGFWAALGNLAGTSLTYWLARMGGRPLVDRAANWLRLDPRYIRFAETQFHKWGPGIVLFGRVVPGIRVLVSVPAGLARMPFPKFLLFSLAGAYLWCTTLVGLGYFLGHEWTQIVRFFLENAQQYLPLVLVAFAALALLGWYAQRSIRRRILARATLAQPDRSE